MVRSSFLLIYLLVTEDYEFPKSTSYILSVLLTLEYVRILSLSIFFSFTLIVYLIISCARCSVLSELMILISTQHVTNHLR